MKRAALITIVAALAAFSVFAQDWTVGGRWGAYAAGADLGTASANFDRKDSTGGFVEIRHGEFVARGQYDSDSRSDADLGGIAMSYERTRYEVAAGWAALPFLDLEIGLRDDSVDMRGDGFFAGVSGGKFKADQQAGLAGIHFHTSQPGRIEWYGTIRAYLGTTDVKDTSGIDDNVGSFGYRVETGLPIAIGDAGWFITPGAEFERFDTDNIGTLTGGLTLDSNRFFISIGYHYRK